MYAKAEEPVVVVKEPGNRKSFSKEENRRRMEIDESWSEREKELRTVEEIPTLDEPEESGFRIK